MAGLEKYIGEVLDGKYRLEKLLGQGGMGAVYLATHLGTERAVALKLIAPQFMRNVEFVERFKREARAAGRLRHPNVVDVTDFGFAETEGSRVAYLVMEYLDGCTLADVLAEEKRLPLVWVVDILEQVCSAVEEAHRQGIVHRDLKPDNIWLEPNRLGGYRIKVLDFGIAKLGEAGGFDEETEPPRPEVDPPAPPAPPHPWIEPRTSGQSSLEAVRAQIERAAASFQSQAGGGERPATAGSEGATQINTAPGDARPEEAATQLYAPPAQGEVEPRPAEEQQTHILTPAADGAAQPTVLDPARAGATMHGRTARETQIEDDAGRTRRLDAPAPDGRTAPQQGRAAALTPPAGGGTRAGSAALTRVGSIMGTPLYMSPEQCRGRRLDPRSDIYSLGVIAYQMLAGETPFAGDMVSVMRQHTEAEPPPLRTRKPKVRKRAARVVMSALAKDPARRPQTAAAFASSLRAHSAGTGTLLRRAFALYSEHFPTFLRLTLIAHLPVFFVTALRFAVEAAEARGGLPDLIIGIATGVALLLQMVASFISNSVISGVTAVIVTQLQLAPLRPVSLRAGFAVLRRRWRPFLRTSVGVTLRIFFGFLLVIPGFWMMIKYALYAPVVLLEGLTKKEARRRADELSRRSRRSVIALMLINMALPTIIGAAVGGLSVRADRGGINVSTRTDQSGVRIVRTEEGGAGEAARGGGGAAGAAQAGKKREVSLATKAFSHLVALLNVVIVPLISITTALLYLKLRQMGGETMRETLAQFEEVEPARSRWQQRMRQSLSARTSQNRPRLPSGATDEPRA